MGNVILAEKSISCRSRCCFCCRVYLYLQIAMLCQFRSLWSWTYEPMGPQCRHPPMPVNQTGLKVLVYGLAKTGTTTTNRYLARLMKAYHGEDLQVHVWAPFVDEFYRRPENGGGMFPPSRLATPGHPAYKGHSFFPRMDNGSDLWVLNHTAPAELAEAISRCRPESLTLDAREDLFWPIYSVSPGAKVIMLSWRSWEERSASLANFAAKLVVMMLGLSYLNVGMHFLPWNAFVMPFWDYLSGHRLSRKLRDGIPLSHLDEGDALLLLFRESITERRICQHWASGFGLSSLLVSKEDYAEHWEVARRIIPPDRLFELDLRKHTMAELCTFLEIKDNPACHSGRMTESYSPQFNHEKEHKMDLAFLVPYYLFIHWANYVICWTLLRWLYDTLLWVCCGWCHCCRQGDQGRAGEKSKVG